MSDTKDGFGKHEALAGCVVPSFPNHQGLDGSGDRPGSGPSDWSLGLHLKRLLLLRRRESPSAITLPFLGAKRPRFAAVVIKLEGSVEREVADVESRVDAVGVGELNSVSIEAKFL